MLIKMEKVIFCSYLNISRHKMIDLSTELGLWRKKQTNALNEETL